MKTIEQMLELVEEPHRTDSLNFVNKNRRLFDSSRGARFNHQDWGGGYRDHVTEVMNIAIVTYKALSGIRPLPFELSDALFACFLHDLEKIWTNKLNYKRQELDKSTIIAYEFQPTEDHLNAVKYTHGEGEDHSKTSRVQRPLAAFVHHCDNTSARIWFDFPAEGDRSLTPAKEYEWIVEEYVAPRVSIPGPMAERMIELETSMNMETLVPYEQRERILSRSKSEE